MDGGGDDGTKFEIDLDDALKRAIRGGVKVTDAHLRELTRDISIDGTRTTLHCYCLPIDGNGRVRVRPLAEFLRDRIIDYAIPRKTIEEAKKQLADSGSTAALVKLQARAKDLFTHLATSGEGGELLLFAMAEAVFGLTQILCKMSLKTSTSLHYNGADGVYAEVRPDGGLNIYWGESKVFQHAGDAIRDCLSSLAPFLREPDSEEAKREQDILLINEFANFDDPAIVNGLKAFLDRDNEKSLQVQHRGFALTAFDSSGYGPTDQDAGKIFSEIETALRSEMPGWSKSVQNRLGIEKLSKFDIHFVCVPIPSAKTFRDYFLTLLGVSDAV